MIQQFRRSHVWGPQWHQQIVFEKKAYWIYLLQFHWVANAKPGTFDQKLRKFCNDDDIWTLKCWSKFTKFTLQRIDMRGYPTPIFLFLALSGAEEPGGLKAPSKARNSQTRSRARVSGALNKHENIKKS